MTTSYLHILQLEQTVFSCPRNTNRTVIAVKISNFEIHKIYSYSHQRYSLILKTHPTYYMVRKAIIAAAESINSAKKKMKLVSF